MVDLPSREIERKLIIYAQTGTSKESRLAKFSLVRYSQPLVHSVAEKYLSYSNGHVTRLLNLGNAGLIKAIDHYDITAKYRFFTYATWWIKTEIEKDLGLA